MANSRIRFLKLQSLSLAICASLGLTSCAEEAQRNKPPFELPFDLGRVGLKTNFEVKIDEKNEYLLGLAFSIDENTAEAARVEGILGAPQLVGSGKWVEPGVPAVFEVQINKQPDNELLFKSSVNHPKTRSGYRSGTADIAVVPLNIGVYSVTVHYVQGSSELASIPVRILFTKAHHGK